MKTNILYSRRSPKQGGETAEKTFYDHSKKYNMKIDNSWVVTYNPILLLMLESYLNVEANASIEAVKYLYKYVYEGNDKIMMQ